MNDKLGAGRFQNFRRTAKAAKRVQENSWKRSQRLTFCLLLTFCSLLYATHSALAQVSPAQILRVSPSILNISLSPGKEYSYKIKVENITKTPLPVRAVFENFTTTDEEGGFVFESPTKNPMSSWVSISDKDMIITAESVRELDLKVKIPKQVPFGGYYMILFFEPLLSEEQTGGANISAKVGVLMLSNIGTSATEKNASILDFKPEPFLLRVQNNGINHFSAKPILKIKNIFGKEETTEIEEKFVFPGKVRRWEKNITLPKRAWGIYKAVILVSTGEGKQIKQEKYFTNFPISKGILTLITVSIGIFLVRKRKNISKAIRILVLNK